MFAFGKTFVRTSRPLLTLGLATWIATASLNAAERRPVDAVPLAAGETWRSPGDEATLSIRLDSPGFLLIDVDVPVAAPTVRLVLLRPQLAGRGDFQLLGQSPTTLTLAGSPGDYLVRVAADDPRQPLAPWRLRTRFAAAPLAPGSAGKTGAGTPTTPDPHPTSGPGTLIEVDPDPNKSDPSDPADPSASGTGTPTTPGPHPTSGPGTLIEVDPDPLKAIRLANGSPAAASRLLRELCRQGEIDDHGDSFACATPLSSGIPAQGALRNDHGDDSDLFRFEVSALGPVELRAHAAFALAGELYDGHGQRLDTAVAEGRGGLRLVRTLVPGTYFLRLSGWNGAEGTYTVALGSPPSNR